MSFIHLPCILILQIDLIGSILWPLSAVLNFNQSTRDWSVYLLPVFNWILQLIFSDKDNIYNSRMMIGNTFSLFVWKSVCVCLFRIYLLNHYSSKLHFYYAEASLINLGQDHWFRFKVKWIKCHISPNLYLHTKILLLLPWLKWPGLNAKLINNRNRYYYI